jgi:topoisomerase IA-like protein
VEQRSLVKDLCDRHVAELTAGTRRAKPGRRRGTVGTARKSAARAKRTTAKKTTAKKTTAKKTTAPKNGRRRPRRPRKATTTESAAS